MEDKLGKAQQHGLAPVTSLKKDLGKLEYFYCWGSKKLIGTECSFTTRKIVSSFTKIFT